VEEIAAGVWDGNDYMPAVFDRWVSDPGASFQAAELDGLVVALHRLRPIGDHLAWYEGLRVDSAYRRRGIARAMLRAAIDEARQRFEEIRLGTGEEAARPLFASEGFEQVLDVTWWRAGRIEGGEPARIPGPAEAEKLEAALRTDPAFAAYAGLNPAPSGAPDLDARELARLAAAGNLRAGPGGRALAGLQPGWSSRILATFVSGAGGALQELLMALRFEADADDLRGVALIAPKDHPGAGDFEAVGYDWRDDPFSFTIHRLRLGS
jgi:GNAT superfamily N-acetyltransferase